MDRALLSVLVLITADLRGQSPGPEAPIAPRLEWQTGKVTLGDDLATLEVPAGLVFLGRAEARMVVEKLWRNPPDPTILGLVLPESGKDLRSWGVVVTYDDSGHVKDEDAASLDFDGMLQSMQKGEAEDNAARRKQGFPQVQLLGWAERPRYDAAARKLYWARRLKFEGNDTNTLNYDVRILGRRGVLVLTAVADEQELATVAQGCKSILAGTQFMTGNRYEDFDAGIDKVAAYGIGGLIAGKLLLKAGIFKALLKPLIVVGVLAAGSLAKVFARKKSATA